MKKILKYQPGGATVGAPPPITFTSSFIPNSFLGQNFVRDLKNSFSTGLRGLGKNILGSNTTDIVGNLSNIGTSLLGTKSEYSGDKGNITKGMDTAYDTIQQGLLYVPGGQLASTAMAAGKFISTGINKLGGGTDGMTTLDAILGSTIGTLATLGINGFGGSKTESIKRDDNLWAEAGASYGGTNADMDNALHKSGKKYGLTSRNAKKSANNQIRLAGRRLNMLSTMFENKNLMNQALANNLDNLQQGYDFQLNGGYDQASMLAAKNGSKLFTKEQFEKIHKVKELLNKPIDSFKEGGEFKFDTSIYFQEEEVQAFKEGGKMNVIPEGALHARLHHMEDETPELKGLITEKGIPVIIEKEGGEVELQAEIEHSEIIFCKEVTEKLENWSKEYFKEDTSKKRKNELAIEAGKLLAELIMENTDDRTNLIEQIQ